ncbi:MAG TPA: hypothetical protein PK385_06865 [Spirochaetota bacterium]|jgi:hypothetical protein|nr:MAG: hypothetical protein BWX91_00439 [Spirochaetes bacterium ADurb.Bin133]HNZ26168.1 hypothetical protein [Spirochaetota bacterium]HOF01454.1 hypothetical protein [Spirochaetota bacterium]HOS33306.1 hypothetical protein [Spirochaetota bacterium]HOS55764.1 hypothetical protein [Spirochaetota bacterium]
MKTDAIIKQVAFKAIFEKLDIVEAERFIALIKRDNFDYTEWRKNLWEDLTIEELSKNAMDYCDKRQGSC